MSKSAGRSTVGSASGASILIVEDQITLAESIASYLRGEGYEVMLAHTGEDGFFIACSSSPALMLLDLNLPGRGGLEVLRQLRALGNFLPVLILTSNNSVDERVAGLDAGADDYLGKPFSLAELGARIRSLLRRKSQTAPDRTEEADLFVDDLHVDLDSRRATRAGVPLELTAREFALLVYLMQHKDRTVSREMLARSVWKETSRYTPIDNVIDVQVTRLRRKIDDPFPKKLLHTIRGVGFTLREAPE